VHSKYQQMRTKGADIGRQSPVCFVLVPLQPTASLLPLKSRTGAQNSILRALRSSPNATSGTSRYPFRHKAFTILTNKHTPYPTDKTYRCLPAYCGVPQATQVIIAVIDSARCRLVVSRGKTARGSSCKARGMFCESL